MANQFTVRGLVREVLDKRLTLYSYGLPWYFWGIRFLLSWLLDCFLQLKNRLQLLTVSIAGIGLISAYISYTPEITLRFVLLLKRTPRTVKSYDCILFNLCWKFCYSFGAGSLGSLAYMRMLGNSVDAMADGARGVMKYVFPIQTHIGLTLSRWPTHSFCLFLW